MALADNRTQRTTMLCAMYAAQGLPWGFMTVAVVSYLTEHGISASDAGDLTAVVLLPWTFKLIWAPFIDTLTIRAMGRRRPWIIGAEFMMALSLLGLIAFGDSLNDLRMLTIMFFVHNCFASLQDVATDALAVDILPPDEQGRANGMMWGAKLIGKGIGASGLAVVMHRWGFTSAVLVQFAVLMIIMLFPLLMVERRGDRRFGLTRLPHEPDADGVEENVEPEAESGVRPLKDVLRDMRLGFGMRTTSLYFVFGITSLIGWGVIEVITKPLYTQTLGWTFVEYSAMEGYSIVLQMAGAWFGGWIADRLGRRLAITLGWGTYGLLAIIPALVPELWENVYWANTYLLLNPCMLAIGSVGFLSMGMRISWTTASATMFTVYMTTSNIGHVVGNKLIRRLEEDLGFTTNETFLTAGLLMWVPLLLLLAVNPSQVDAAKMANAPADDEVDAD